MTNLIESWQQSSRLGPCACSELRRATRRVSAFYDSALRAAGLTVTQHSLLVNIARAGEISRTGLAARVGMDRTTLTRNLLPLERAKLVEPAPASTDRRERLLRLSTAGRRKLRASYPLWEKAQQGFAEEFGPERLEKLRRLLEQAQAAASALAEG